MIDLSLHRDTFSPETSIGKLSINGLYYCETLEDQTRAKGVKIPGETCIPEGRYKIRLIKSPKRGYIVPLLLDVPMFTAIEIHIGNTRWDTRGCILVGRLRGVDRIMDSSMAFWMLMNILKDDPEIQITITSDWQGLQAAGLAA
jgi:hypothetical protein